MTIKTAVKTPSPGFDTSDRVSVIAAQPGYYVVIKDSDNIENAWWNPVIAWIIATDTDGSHAWPHPIVAPSTNGFADDVDIDGKTSRIVYDVERVHTDFSGPWPDDNNTLSW